MNKILQIIAAMVISGAPVLDGSTSYGSCAKPNTATGYCAIILQLASYQGPKDDLFVCNAVKFGWRYG